MVQRIRTRKVFKSAKRITTVSPSGAVRIEEDVRIKRIVRGCKPAPIVVTLPDVSAIPANLRGTEYTVRSLLTDGEDNPKLAKSNEAKTVYRTWGLALSPSTQSGFQTCASASPGCRAVCLNVQGMGRVFPSIQVSRIAKTVAFFTQRERFLSLLRWELQRIAKRALKEHFVPAVRLNVLSDIPWEKIAPWIFSEFPGFQFYDYTKHARRALDFASGKLPSNYHLTFSRSECNQADCLAVLAAGGNVAVVFSSKAIPETWQGYRVINGDETDLRFTDARNVVVGLYAKGTAAQDDSGFVVPVRGVLSLPTVN
jgi:hypothetical protein